MLLLSCLARAPDENEMTARRGHFNKDHTAVCKAILKMMPLTHPSHSNIQKNKMKHPVRSILQVV